MIRTEPLVWHGCTREQARGVCMRNGISGRLLSLAVSKLSHPSWSFGAHIYVWDMMTDKAARVTAEGCGEFSVKVSSRTGETMVNDLESQLDAIYGVHKPKLDTLVVIG